MAEKKYSVLRKCLLGFTALLILLFFLESVASIAYYQRNGGSRFALVGLYHNAMRNLHGLFNTQKGSRNQQLVRPDSTLAVSEQIKAETSACNKTVYDPWLQFRIADYTGKYVHVKGYNRLSIPWQAGSGAENKDTLTIFFLGGSTMFGYNVSDQETIPAQFATLYQQQYPTGRPVRVLNFGNPYYYSYQELMQFTQLLSSGSKPDMVVELDGLNDCLQIRSSLERIPMLTNLIQQVFIRGAAGGSLVDSNYLMYLPPPDMKTEVYGERIYRNLLENLRLTRDLAASHGIKPFFFIQPVPYYHYPNRSHDPICIQDERPQFNYIYPLLDKASHGSDDIQFLGNMLEQEKGLPFVDNYHYSPRMNKRIASAILEKIAPSMAAFHRDTTLKNKGL